MAHARKRYIEKYLKLAAQASPIVGLVGQRQTGKTTLISAWAKEYVTLDHSTELQKANSEPEAFLLNRDSSFGIDECQLAPPLFPALKEYVRRHPARGKFLLSGSVRFTSRKAIQESLTGRILTLELLPFSLSEMHGLPQKNPTDPKHLKGSSHFKLADFNHFVKMGGMPGISFRRNEKIRYRLWKDHIATLIERDLKLIIQTTLRFDTIYKLLTVLAELVGSPLDFSEISRETRISRVTLRKLISAFENMFLIRLIPCEGGISTPRIFFEDVGMLSYLLESRFTHESRYRQAFYQCVRTWFFYSSETHFEFFQFLTRGGAQVDLGVRRNGQTTGWIISSGSEIDQSMLNSAHSFQNKYGSEAQVMIIGPQLQYQEIKKNIFMGPLLNLL